MPIIDENHVCDLDCLIWSDTIVWGISDSTAQVRGVCPTCDKVFLEIYIARGVKDPLSDEYLRIY